MASITRYALTFALAACAALVPARASAQTINLKGAFDLPMKAHWSQMTLVPGHYTVVVAHELSGFSYLRLNGPQGSQMKIVNVSSLVNTTDTNYLRLERTGSEYVVREFHCGSIGQVYRFSIPKQLRQEAKNDKGAPQQALVAINSHNK
jgi:hypothetical protein